MQALDCKGPNFKRVPFGFLPSLSNVGLFQFPRLNNLLLDVPFFLACRHSAVSLHATWSSPFPVCVCFFLGAEPERERAIKSLFTTGRFRLCGGESGAIPRPLSLPACDLFHSRRPAIQLLSFLRIVFQAPPHRPPHMLPSPCNLLGSANCSPGLHAHYPWKLGRRP